MYSREGGGTGTFASRSKSSSNAALREEALREKQRFSANSVKEKTTAVTQPTVTTPKPAPAAEKPAEKPVQRTDADSVSAPKTQSPGNQENDRVAQLATELEGLRDLYAQVEELENQRINYAGKPYSSTYDKEIKKLTAQIYALGKDYALVEHSIYGIPDNIRIALEEKEKQFNAITGGPREATWKDVIVNSLSRGYYNAKFGEESYKDMVGSENEKDAYQEILNSEQYDYQVYGLLKKAVSGAAELFGQQIRQWTHPETVATGGTAAATAFFLGQAGPQAGVPEELLTVPTAYVAGTKVASAKLAYQMEAGFAYNEMIEKGVSKETAKTIAQIIGVANAALEFAQLDELCDAYKLTTKAGAKTTAKFIWDILADHGIYVAKEAGTEVLQEGTTMLGVQAGSQIDKGESAYTWDEVQQRLEDTGRDSLLAFGTLGAPAVGRNISGVTQNKNVGWDGREVVTEATGKSITMDGKKYEFLGYDKNGSPVYQDAEVLADQATGEKAPVDQDKATQTQEEQNGNPEWFSAAVDSAKEASADSRDNLTSVAKGHIMDLQRGFMCFPEGDPLIENSQKVTPKDGCFDVAMHGEPTAVAFGGKESNMSPRLLAEVIRHNPNYHGENIRLLCCSTGLQIDGAYCFAEELANALGVTVEAPNMEVFTAANGTIKVGRYNEGQMIEYRPNERGRLK